MEVRAMILVALVAGAALPGASSAQDGSALFAAKACVTCHGEQGKAPIAPGYPKLAGQNAEYLARQIKDIRDGRRTNGQSSVMRAMISGLTDAEADAIAQYLSALE